MTDPLARAKSKAVGIADRLPGLLLAAQRIAATIEQGVHGRRRAARRGLRHTGSVPGRRIAPAGLTPVVNPPVYLRQMG
jgi:hypothetical protein